MKEYIKVVVKHNKKRQPKYIEKFYLDTDFDSAMEVLVGRKKPTKEMIQTGKE